MCVSGAARTRANTAFGARRRGRCAQTAHLWWIESEGQEYLTGEKMSGNVGGTKTFAHEQPKGYSTNVRPRMMTQFGTMVASNKASAPAAGMGTSNREGREKVFMSEVHALHSMRGQESPGPVYRPRTKTEEILVRESFLHTHTPENPKK